MLAVVAIELYQLCKIGLTREYIFHASAVKMESVCGQLKPMFFRDAIPQISQETVGCLTITTANGISRNQLCLSINSNKNPSIT